MDEAFVKKLETRAYYAVVRAFAASNKLNFDTEALLMDLQQALSLEDEAAMNLVAEVDGDEEVTLLKAYEGGTGKMTSAPSASLPALQAAKPTSRPAAQSYQQESPFNQPAAKKQKKTPGGSLPPPSGLARIPSASPTVKAAAQPASKGKTFRAPRGPVVSSAPSGGALVTAGSALVQRNSKAVRPTISAATFSRIMQGGSTDDMEAYLTELNGREREIFTELIAQGVNEHDPELNELHRELIRWYKLDHRQAVLSQQLVTTS